MSSTGVTPTQPDMASGIRWIDHEYKRRVKQGKDWVVLIDDVNNDRGSGKTTLAIKLADRYDRTEEGLTPDKCFIDVDDLIYSYTDKPHGSAFVLDEAEVGLSKYDANTLVNRTVRRLVSMGRVEEKMIFATLPNVGELDRDLMAMCNVWVMVEIRGRALVHELAYNKYRGKTLTPKRGRIEWSAIDTDRQQEIYDSLMEEKLDYLGNRKGDSNLIKYSEAEAMVEREVKKAKLEGRDEAIRAIYGTADITQQEIADAIGVNRTRITQVVA